MIFQNLFGGMFENSRNRAGAKWRDRSMQSATVLEKPHFHSGLGTRRLRRDYFECRAGIDIRLVFRAGKGRLTFLAAGDHDAIRRLLKGL